MPSITIKDIPEDLYARFKAIAQAERRSINAEVIVAMDELVQSMAQRDERLAALKRINEQRRKSPICTLDVVELLREDRER